MKVRKVMMCLFFLQYDRSFDSIAGSGNHSHARRQFLVERCSFCQTRTYGLPRNAWEKGFGGFGARRAFQKSANGFPGKGKQILKVDLICFSSQSFENLNLFNYYIIVDY